jgi:hypothetical protein
MSKHLEIKTEYKSIICPFCGEDDFDLIGLKHHIENYCEIYQSTLSVDEERKIRKIIVNVEHSHTWENDKSYTHSHPKGEIPHGHHGSRYGEAILPKIIKGDLEIKKDGVFDD